MRRPRLFAAAAAAAACVGLLQVPSTAGAATPQHGGTLSFAVLSMQTNLAPTSVGVSYADAAPSAGSIYGYLGYLDYKTGAIQYSFLKTMKASNGEKTWTLVLHPGIKFSDGTPLDAAAIQYNLQKMADPNSGDANYQTIATWKEHVVNATTLTVTLPSADAGFPAEMTQEFPWIGSPTAWTKEGAGFDTHPVGAGPFKIQSLTQNAQMTLVPNPYYKDFAPGEPYLDKIVVNETSQPTQLTSALQSGVDQAAWLEGSQQFQQVRTAGLNVRQVLASGGEYLVFNTSRAPFNNLLVRKAVSDALNHAELAKIWVPGSQPFNNLFAPTSPYYNPKYNFSGTNTAQATKLFTQLHNQGADLNMTFVGVTSFPQVGAYLQSTLDKYPGVHVNIKLEPISQWASDGKTGNFDLFGFLLDFVNPWPSVQQYFSGTAGSNYGHWSDPKVNQALKVITKTANPAILKKNYELIAKEIATQDPIFAAQNSAFAYATAKSVQGVHLVEFGTTPLTAGMWLNQ